MKYLCFFAIILLIALVNPTYQVAVTLPVPQEVLTKVTLSIDRLIEVLKTFNTKNENRWEIYKRVYLTNQYLNELKASLAQYNNVIVGAGNGVLGNKNLVIGNYNNITGSNNWVFVSKFTGNINSDLLVGDWRVELDKTQYILINPKFAISYIKEERNKKMYEKYAKKHRNLCQFDKWSKPEDEKPSKHWEKYEGFEEYKNESNKKKENLKKDIGGIGSFLNKFSW